MAKIKIRKNDTVIVTTGNSKGVKGKVIKVSEDELKSHENYLKTSLQKNFYN